MTIDRSGALAAGLTAVSRCVAWGARSTETILPNRGGARVGTREAVLALMVSLGQRWSDLTPWPPSRVGKGERLPRPCCPAPGAVRGGASARQGRRGSRASFPHLR